jgi:hypothetical protein
MNSLTDVLPIEAAAARKATLKQRLFTVGFFAATGIAMGAWASALGWAAFRLASWLFA